MTDRPDPPVDDVVDLASRYLDGELGVDERAATEADAAVMAWVARFGDLQRALREPVEVDATVRESSLAMALAAFDDEITSRPAAPVVSDLAAARARRAGRLGTWLGAAAAAAAVAIGGVALTGNLGGNTASDRDATGATTAAAEKTDGGAADRSAEDSSSVLAAEAPMAAPAYESGPATESTAAANTAAGDATASIAEAATTVPTGAGATTVAAADATAAPEVVADGRDLDDSTDLQPYVTSEPVTLPAGTPTPCAAATGVLVATDVTFAGTPAAVYRDDSAHVIRAYAADSCVVLASAAY